MPSSISKQSGKLWGKNGSAYHRLGKCWVYKKEIREGYITRWQNGRRHNKKTQVNKQEKMNRKNQAFLCVMGLKHSERKGNKKKEDLHLPFWFAYKKKWVFSPFCSINGIVHGARARNLEKRLQEKILLRLHYIYYCRREQQNNNNNKRGGGKKNLDKNSLLLVGFCFARLWKKRASNNSLVLSNL